MTTLASRALQATGLTQRGLAHALGVSLSIVNRWANGRSEPGVVHGLVLEALASGTEPAAMRARVEDGRVVGADRRRKADGQPAR